MAAWYDEDERELWLLEYNRSRDEGFFPETAVRDANTVLAIVRAQGVFDEEIPPSFEALRTETVQDAIKTLEDLREEVQRGAMDSREYLGGVQGALEDALAELPLDAEDEEDVDG